MTVAPEDAATTGHKTHRYLRLSLVLIVFALLISVLIQTVVVSWDPFHVGWNLLPSISHYYYTGARSVFVGALIATSFALLALSGRGPATTLLDIAAIFAPLIALVPTGVHPDHPVGGETCPVGDACIPAAALVDARVGVATYAVVVITAVIVMAAIRAKKHITTRSAGLVSTIAVATAVVVAALAFIPGVNADFPFNFWPFPSSIHFLVTLLFFGTFAAVPIRMRRGQAEDGEKPPSARQRRIYGWVGWLLIADLVMLVLAFLFRSALGGIPLILIGEVIALVLFAAFWWVQTFQRWGDPDQAGLAPIRSSDAP